MKDHYVRVPVIRKTAPNETETSLDNDSGATSRPVTSPMSRKISHFPSSYPTTANKNNDGNPDTDGSRGTVTIARANETVSHQRQQPTPAPKSPVSPPRRRPTQTIPYSPPKFLSNGKSFSRYPTAAPDGFHSGSGATLVFVFATMIAVAVAIAYVCQDVVDLYFFSVIFSPYRQIITNEFFTCSAVCFLRKSNEQPLQRQRTLHPPTQPSLLCIILCPHPQLVLKPTTHQDPLESI